MVTWLVHLANLVVKGVGLREGQADPGLWIRITEELRELRVEGLERFFKRSAALGVQVREELVPRLPREVQEEVVLLAEKVLAALHGVKIINRGNLEELRTKMKDS